MGGDSERTKKYEILDHVLSVLMLPLLIIAAGMEAGEDLSLSLTRGKYSGRGSLGRRDKRLYGWDTPKLLKPHGYSKRKLKEAIWRGEKKRLLEKRISKDGFVDLVLTDVGRDRIYKKHPFMRLANKKWKGWWLVVTFDIPEEERKRRNFIRKQLCDLGFVQWQLSVYISPHDIADDLYKMLKENKLENFVVPMISKRILAGSDSDFVERLYHLEDLRHRYKQIVKGLKVPTGVNKIHFKIFSTQLDIFKVIIKDDPFLPEGLVPAYGREEAYRALAKFAQFLSKRV